jgi:hypothetical protein
MVVAMLRRMYPSAVVKIIHVDIINQIARGPNWMTTELSPA